MFGYVISLILDVKTRPMNCGDVCKGSDDGIYRIYPDGTNEGIEVYCELEDGWTVMLC